MKFNLYRRAKRQWEREQWEKRIASPFHLLVKKMSNKQRHRWAQAGYPGLRERDYQWLKGYVSDDTFEAVHNQELQRQEAAANESAVLQQQEGSEGGTQQAD